MEQFVCPGCQTLVSVRIVEGVSAPPTCEECKGPLEAWPGIADRREAWPHQEVLEGPCPRCSEPLRMTKIGLWD
jgi:hypothetical protein